MSVAAVAACTVCVKTVVGLTFDFRIFHFKHLYFYGYACGTLAVCR